MSIHKAITLVESGAPAGGLYFLENHAIAREAFIARLIASGKDVSTVPEATPRGAARRALETVGRFATKGAKFSSHKLYHVCEEPNHGADGHAHREIFRAQVHSDGIRWYLSFPERLAWDPERAGWRQQMRDAFNSSFDRELQMLTSEELAPWWATQFSKSEGVRCLTGWFVPEHRDAEMKPFEDALAGSEVVFARLDAKHTAAIAKGVFEGLLVEASKVQEDVQAWVEAEREKILTGARESAGTRGVNAKTRDIAAMVQKLDTYRRMLAVDVAGPIEELDRLRYRVLDLQRVSASTAEGRAGERRLELDGAPVAAAPDVLPGPRPLDLDDPVDFAML